MGDEDSNFRGHLYIFYINVEQPSAVHYSLILRFETTEMLCLIETFAEVSLLSDI